MKHPVSFKLSTSTVNKLIALANTSRMTRTAIVETLIANAVAVDPLPTTPANKKQRAAAKLTATAR